MSGGIHKFPEVGPEDYEVCTTNISVRVAVDLM